MPAHHITDTEFSSSDINENEMFRTPSVTDSTGGARSEKQASERGQMVKTADQVVQLAYQNGLKVSPAIEKSLMPTPTVSDQFTANLKSTQQTEGSMHSVTLAQIFHRPDLMPTSQARDHKDGTAERIRDGQIQTDSVAKTILHSGEVNDSSWGKFAPAIKRWEQTLQRPAPAPTKPDGKDGAHRLSSKFTEWMMGLNDGHITDAGLTRAEELKAAGNGVVPQQAALALRILLDGVNW